MNDLTMPEITEDELVAHIEDPDFLLAYGNPVIVRSKDGNHDCVVCSIRYFERMQQRLQVAEQRIQKILRGGA